MSEFNFKKKYGQNFLIDDTILEKICNATKAQKEDLIIEIGPGSGNLTKKLKEFNAQILAYEIDPATKIYLEQLVNQSTTFVYDDFLKRDLNHDLKIYNYQNLYIVANLPYYITTPIIEKIIHELKPKQMILMVQKEVADRLAAKPKTKAYGYMTVYLNYYFKITKLFDVKKTAFRPVPNVESALLEFTSHNLYKCQNEPQFFKLIKDAFKHKRKTLNNNLNSYPKEKLTPILAKHDLSLASRAEEIPIDVFIEIADAL